MTNESPWKMQLTINRLDRRVIKQQEEVAELKAKLDNAVIINRIPVVNYPKWRKEDV